MHLEAALKFGPAFIYNAPSEDQNTKTLETDDSVDSVDSVDTSCRTDTRYRGEPVRTGSVGVREAERLGGLTSRITESLVGSAAGFPEAWMRGPEKI